jgi:4-methylaminobutanoate oxidase (formaldehyde-forming)
MNSRRIEKTYRHWGHDITDEDTPVFAVDLNAVKRQKESEIAQRLAALSLQNPDHMLYHSGRVSWRCLRTRLLRRLDLAI